MKNSSLHVIKMKKIRVTDRQQPAVIHGFCLAHTRYYALRQDDVCQCHKLNFFIALYQECVLSNEIFTC